MHGANKTITFVHIIEDGSTSPPVIINGASWHESSIANKFVTDKGLRFEKSVLCLLPIENVPEDFRPSEGDMLLLGNPTIPIDACDVKLKKDYGAVTVKGYEDNRSGIAPHWKMECV